MNINQVPRRRGFVLIILSVIFGLIGHAASFTQDKPRSQPSLSQQVQGIINQHCLACHLETKSKAGLRLDKLTTEVTSVKHGVLAPGNADASLLYQRIISANDQERMPPEKPALSKAEADTIRQWILALEKGSISSNTSGKPVPWSYQPISKPGIPKVRQAEWVCSPIDAFILARLEQKGITPSPVADRLILMRRLYLDLLGLLPTPEEVQAYREDNRPDAYEKLVDRLLASKHFGEKWGRAWLDLARYADSDGYEHDEPRPHAYHFRDWVIKAFNQDMPFDQFTLEQLAGDLLPAPTESQWIASGFHRQTMRHNTAEMFAEDFRITTVKDRVSTTGMVWLGMTIGCAECHDHKYDPVSQEDYYRLYAVFNDAQERVVGLSEDKQIATFEHITRDAFLHQRGNPAMPGPKMRPGIPAALPAWKPADKHATRLDLARWLVQKDNPLTPRVEVNRIWKQLFGSGLVTSPDDFGNHGQSPSHPELLDWLALELRDNGWKRKPIIRKMVLSSTYRQSSHIRPELKQLDPLNRLLARQNRFPLDAENIYDISLQVAGMLQLEEIGGPSFQPPLPTQLELNLIKNNRLMETSETYDRYRRGIYLQVQRTYQHPFLATFHAPDSSISCAMREQARTPAQALMMLNDPIFQECCEQLQNRIREHADAPEQRIRFGFKLCLGREPVKQEVAILLDLVKRLEKSMADAPWLGFASVLLNLEGFTTRE
ncbi:MAG: PSD1 domain-containing protein [Planctomycetia bacterium]|nr:PSD1 domain-containing protein [Planctomycetia bacterium]